MRRARSAAPIDSEPEPDDDGRHRIALVVALGCAALVLLLGSFAYLGREIGSPAGRVVLPYDVPLYVARTEARHPSAGAAGNVVQCDTWGGGGFSDQEVYGEGATARSPAQALNVSSSENGFAGVQKGLRIGKRDKDRVLYVLEVEGVTKQAVIVRNGPATAGAGGPGWYVESSAHCDYSELPRSFTDSIGLQIWSDTEGRPAPTSTIASSTGPEHCDWQSMTFLELKKAKATFVRAPKPELQDYFVAPYEAHAVLPAAAVDTGFGHDGDHLWLSQDKQRAYVGTSDDVEVWPRMVKPLWCV